jgi:hypothetical protein
MNVAGKQRVEDPEGCSDLPAGRERYRHGRAGTRGRDRHNRREPSTARSEDRARQHEPEPDQKCGAECCCSRRRLGDPAVQVVRLHREVLAHARVEGVVDAAQGQAHPCIECGRGHAEHADQQNRTRPMTADLTGMWQRGGERRHAWSIGAPRASVKARTGDPVEQPAAALWAIRGVFERRMNRKRPES